MTLPIPNPDKPKDVLSVGEVGAATQNLNPAKTKATSIDRMSDGFLNSNAGLAGGVVTTATNLFGNFIGKIADDSDPTTVADPSDVSNQVQGFFGSPITALFDSILGFLSPILQGLGEGLSGIAGMLAGLFQLRWDQVDEQGNALADNQSKVNDLSLARGHATAYMPTSPGTTTTPTRMPFTAIVGTMRGVTSLGNGQFRLDSAGEWDLSAQVEFYGGMFMPPETYLEIVVLYPAGNNAIYDNVQAKASTDSNVTVTNVTSTQVPTPGYRVEVRAWTSGIPILGGSFRGLSGGYKTTRLRIRKFEMIDPPEES